MNDLRGSCVIVCITLRSLMCPCNDILRGPCVIVCIILRSLMCHCNDIFSSSCLIAMTHEPLNMIQNWIWHMSTLTNTILTPWEHILFTTKYCKPHHMEHTHSTPSEHILHFRNTWKSHVVHPQKPFSLRQTTSHTIQYGKNTLENLQNKFYTCKTCDTFKTPEQHTFYTFKTP